jgi:hypothetical protein
MIDGSINMNSLDLFLVQYGLAAIFILLLIKTIGIPMNELWHEGICPACLALYAANQMRLPINVGTLYGESVPGTQPGKGSLTHGNNF